MSTPTLSRSAQLEQQTFRALLSAMSMPGTITTLPDQSGEDGPWHGLIAIARTLLDHEVTFHVAAPGSPVEELILRRTGARTAPLDRAGYVFADATRALDVVHAALEGPLEEPERTATVVLLCDAIGHGGLSLALDGPGVDGEATLLVGGLAPELFRARSERNWPFPVGIDLILVDPHGRVAALPRSTTVTLAAPAAGERS